MPARFKSLVDMQERSCREHADRNALGAKVHGAYRWITYAELALLVDRFRAGLAQLGVGRGDKVAVISNNRPEWAVAAYATYGLGAHFVPMYEAQHPDEWRFILADCGAKVLLTSTPEIHRRAQRLVDEIPTLQRVICFEGECEAEDTYHHLLALGEKEPVPSIAPDLDETAGLIYTSGTTGNPKGVELTHGNVISNINAVHECFPMSPDDVSCSFLPWAHSFGQTCELHTLLSMGAAIGIAESVNTLMDDFLEVRPTLLFAVPRIFNRIYDGLHKRMADESPLRRGMFERGLAVGRRRRELAERGRHSLWLEIKYRIFDRLVFSKVKARFGGRLRYVFSGGAALSKEVGEFIDDVGILVFEGYGLTETAPIVTANRPDARRMGTVGKPLPGVEVYICDEDGRVLPADTDGEVVVVGPNVMKGYFGLPEATDEVMFDLDGKRAFRTGDMGRLDPDGFLRITGRFKEQYKLENGKYVVPTPLEEQLQLSGFISRVFIYGDNRPHNVCLVLPDFEAVAKWAGQVGIDAKGGPEALIENPRVHAKIGEELARFGAGFKSFEKPRTWRLIREDFTPENGLLTPKLSVKRRQVVERYRDVLEALYAE